MTKYGRPARLTSAEDVRVAPAPDFDLADFVELTAQPVGTASPLAGGPSRELTRTPEDEARFQRYHATLKQCREAAWLVAQFTALAVWIRHAGGPEFEVPKHFISPPRWRVVLCYAAELLCELRSEYADAGQAARSALTLRSVLAGLEGDEANRVFEDLMEQRIGAKVRAGGRKGHLATYGDAAEKDDTVRRIVEALANERRLHPKIGVCKAREAAAKRLGVSVSTVRRAESRARLLTGSH